MQRATLVIALLGLALASLHAVEPSPNSTAPPTAAAAANATANASRRLRHRARHNATAVGLPNATLRQRPHGASRRRRRLRVRRVRQQFLLPAPVLSALRVETARPVVGAGATPTAPTARGRTSPAARRSARARGTRWLDGELAARRSRRGARAVGVALARGGAAAATARAPPAPPPAAPAAPRPAAPAARARRRRTRRRRRRRAPRRRARRRGAVARTPRPPPPAPPPLAAPPPRSARAACARWRRARGAPRAPARGVPPLGVRESLPHGLFPERERRRRRKRFEPRSGGGGGGGGGIAAAAAAEQGREVGDGRAEARGEPRAAGARGRALRSAAAHRRRDDPRGQVGVPTARAAPPPRPSSVPRTADAFFRLQAAHEVLADADRKAEYDRMRDLGAFSGGGGGGFGGGAQSRRVPRAAAAAAARRRVGRRRLRPVRERVAQRRGGSRGGDGRHN